MWYAKTPRFLNHEPKILGLPVLRFFVLGLIVSGIQFFVSDEIIGFSLMLALYAITLRLTMKLPKNYFLIKMRRRPVLRLFKKIKHVKEKEFKNHSN